MATLTVYGEAADDYIASKDSTPTYSAARAGSGSLFLGSADLGTTDRFFAGQNLTGEPAYIVYEGFFGFDTSALTTFAVVSAVTLSLYATGNDLTSGDFTNEVRLSNYVGSVSTADYVPGASLSGKTRVATFNTAGMSVGVYNDFTEDGTNFQTGLNLSGITELLINSSKTVSNTAPTAGEYCEWLSEDVGGTSFDPKLTVTYTLLTGITVSITSDSDDAFEIVGSSLANDATATGGAGQQAVGLFGGSAFDVGLRFQNIVIPPGSTIDAAAITVNVLAITGTPDTTIYGADVDDVAVWSNPGNLPSAASRTSASADADPGSVGLQPIDVTAIVAEIIARGGWASGNDMGFVLINNAGAGNNLWTFEDYSAAGTAEAILEIAFTPPPPPTREQEGYRWRNDNGSETTATWKAAQDTPSSVASQTALRLRILVDTGTSDPPSEAFKLQYRRVGDPDWENVLP